LAWISRICAPLHRCRLCARLGWNDWLQRAPCRCRPKRAGTYSGTFSDINRTTAVAQVSVPEPSTLALLGISFMTLGLVGGRAAGSRRVAPITLQRLERPAHLVDQMGGRRAGSVPRREPTACPSAGPASRTPSPSRTRARPATPCAPRTWRPRSASLPEACWARIRRARSRRVAE